MAQILIILRLRDYACRITCCCIIFILAIPENLAVNSVEINIAYMLHYVPCFFPPPFFF